jgi:WD40 repeat protein
VRRWLWTVCLCWASQALAAEPPTDLILRIDPGMHTSPIWRFGIDAQARWLVTGSDDKTARVWDLKTGQLQRVLRPPLGPDLEGRVLGVALSPDGATVVLGGYTQFNDGRSELAPEGHSIYFFDRATGRMLKRLGDLPNMILELAFSADGQYLAAGLGSNGVRLYRTDGWDLVGQDTDYGDGSYGVDFSRDGRRLVTSSYDGYVRLYGVSNSGLRLVAKRAAPGGKQPESIRFSPDGRSIAVGFVDTPVVDVLDGTTLALRYTPNTAHGLVNVKVAWSVDGQTLFASDFANGKFLIRRWSQGGQGGASDTPAAEDTVTCIRALPRGGVVFVSADPAWGLIDAEGVRTRFVAGPIVDFRGASGPQVSRDGRTVRFSYDGSSNSLAYFDPEHGLRLGEGPAMPLASPRVKAPGLAITDWQNNASPKLNGTPLALEANEHARSAAIAGDGKRFVVGTDYYIRLYDRSGIQRWRIIAPGEPWSLNISSDGQTVVAALGDGTIRWYDIKNGREKLALFPHVDRKRWVAWTPSGYYQASPGGEDLIGWHQNRGRDAAADFFPASRFRAKFSRPDVIARAVGAASEAEALRLADAEGGRTPGTAPASAKAVLPPVLEILAPRDGTAVASSSVTVRYAVRSPTDAPMTELRARVNGQAVALGGKRGLSVSPSRDALEVTVPIHDKDNEIALFAVNKNGVSTPATLHLTWAGKAPVSMHETAFKPKLYVLAVGVSKYANPTFNLDLPAKDARDFAAVLMKQKGRLYGDVQVRLLTDAEATKDNVLDGLEWLQHEVTAHDVSMVFLAGHGMNDNNGRYYFLPHNADPDKLMRTGVPQSDIRDTLSALTGKAVFFVDTCHSGNALGTAKSRGVEGETDALVNDLAAAENGVVVFTASTGRQYSLEDPAWGNGAFTKAVVEGLDGKADLHKSGRITLKGLDYYIDERVKELTRGRQSPVSITPSGVADFPIAAVIH